MSTLPRAAAGRGPWLATLCAARAAASLVFLNFAAAIPTLRQEWSLSATEAGLIQSAFQIGHAVSLVGASTASDWFGARRVFLASTALAAALGLLFGLLAHGFWSALVLYGMVALAIGGTYTPVLILIAHRYEGPRRGRAMGYFIGATSVGNALSLGATGLVLSNFGWRAALLATGAGPAIALGLGWLALRGHGETLPGGQLVGRFVSDVIRNRGGMLLIWGYTAHAWELLGMWGWTPAFLVASAIAAGARPETALLIGPGLAAALHLGGAISSGVSGVLSDRWGRTGMILVLSAISTLCSFLFGWLIGGPLAIVVLVGAIYALAAIGDSGIYSTGLSEVVPHEILGSALALRSLLGFGAGGLAAAAFGLVLDVTNPAGGAAPTVWGWAFAVLGIGALPSLWATARLRSLPESARLAAGKR